MGHHYDALYVIMTHSTSFSRCMALNDTIKILNQGTGTFGIV